MVMQLLPSLIGHTNMSTSNGHSGGKTIAWDRPKLNRFKKALKEVKLDHLPSSFTFDGHEFDFRYAAYLVEYLEERLK
jgi:hypothetical protein